MAANHKELGLGYLLASIHFGILGVVMSLVMRYEITWLSNQLVCEGTSLYESAFTFHGLVMIFFFIMPSLFGAFSNYFIPLYLGSSEVAYPRLNNLSLLLLLLSFALLLGILVSEHVSGPGWTLYPPLSTQSGMLVMLGSALFIVGLSSTLTSLNMLATILAIRSPGYLLGMQSYLVWSTLITSVLLLVFLPVLTAGVLMLLGEAAYSIPFFDSEASGDPVLFQHLFWVFGHPEVYIIILPAFGLISQIMATIGLIGHSAMLLAMGCIGVVGSLVWVHHMNTAGLDADSRSFFSLLSLLIAIPTGTKLFNWALTQKYSLRPSVICATLFLLTFTIGGTTGILLASSALDISLHDTYYVVAHFHTVLSVGAISALFGALAYYSNHFKVWALTTSRFTLCALTSIPLVALGFTPQHFLGFGTAPRRVISSQAWSWQYLSSLGLVMSITALLL